MFQYPVSYIKMKKTILWIALTWALVWNPELSKWADKILDITDVIWKQTSSILLKNTVNNEAGSINVELSKAIMRSNLDEIKQLLSSWKSIRREDYYYYYWDDPILYALQNKKYTELKLILDSWIKIKTTEDSDLFDMSCLSMSLNSWDEELFKKMLATWIDKNAWSKNHNKTLLMEVIEKWDLEKVKVLLRNWFDPNYWINHYPMYGRTAVDEAIYYWKTEIVKYLIENGADINKKRDHSTYLESAVSSGNKDIIDYLLSKGMYINEVYKNSTPLITSIYTNDSILDFLIDRWAKVNEWFDYENRYRSALDAAIWKWKFNITQRLLDRWAIPNDTYWSATLPQYISNLPYVIGVNIWLGNKPEDLIGPYKYYEDSVSVFENLISVWADVLIIDRDWKDVIWVIDWHLEKFSTWVKHLDTKEWNIWDISPWMRAKYERNIALLEQLRNKVIKKYQKEKTKQNELLKWYMKMSEYKEVTFVPISSDIIELKKDNFVKWFLNIKKWKSFYIDNLLRSLPYHDVFWKTKDWKLWFILERDMNFARIDSYDDRPIKKDTYEYYIAWRKLDRAIEKAIIGK